MITGYLSPGKSTFWTPFPLSAPILAPFEALSKSRGLCEVPKATLPTLTSPFPEFSWHLSLRYYFVIWDLRKASSVSGGQSHLPTQGAHVSRPLLILVPCYLLKNLWVIELKITIWFSCSVPSTQLPRPLDSLEEWVSFVWLWNEWCLGPFIVSRTTELWWAVVPREVLAALCSSPTPRPVHLSHLAVPELHPLKRACHSRQGTFPSSVSCSNESSNLRKDCGNPLNLGPVGSEGLVSLGTCDWHLKGRQPCETEPRPVGSDAVSRERVSEVNWIIGCPAGVPEVEKRCWERWCKNSEVYKEKNNEKQTNEKNSAFLVYALI